MLDPEYREKENERRRRRRERERIRKENPEPAPKLVGRTKRRELAGKRRLKVQFRQITTREGKDADRLKRKNDYEREYLKRKLLLDAQCDHFIQSLQREATQPRAWPPRAETPAPKEGSKDE